MTTTIPFVLTIARMSEKTRSHAVFLRPVSQVLPCPLLLLPTASLPLSPPAPATTSRLLTHSHSRSRILWLFWLVLAIVSLHRVTLVHVNALPMPLPTSSSDPSQPVESSGPVTQAQAQASTEVLPITFAYYDSNLDRSLTKEEVNELRWAEMQERERKDGETGEVGREEEPKEEGEQTKEKQGKIRGVLKTTYAAVSPGLCFGVEICFVYQRNSQGLPTIKTDVRVRKISHRHDSKYQRPLQVSLVLGSDSNAVVSQPVSRSKNSNKPTQTTHARNTKEALFETFSSLTDLRSALNTHHITDPISSGESFCSAMLQLMQAMDVLRGIYNKDQTLEQNMMSKWRPFWASLRFGFMGPTVPDESLVWQRYKVKGKVVQPRFVNWKDIKQTQLEAAETERAEIEDFQETVEIKGSNSGSAPSDTHSPDTMHLCFEAWRTCFVLISTETAELAILERKLVMPRTKRLTNNLPDLEYHPRVNLRLDEWHVESWKREHPDAKLETNTMEEGSMAAVPVDKPEEERRMAPVAMDGLRKELSNIKLLEKSSGIDISNAELLIHAILKHLQKTCWLSLTKEELEKNLKKPLLDLVYVDFIEDKPASSSQSTPNRKKRLAGAGQNDDHKSDTSSSRHSFKKTKLNRESDLRSSTRSSRSGG
ncbi:hypothetical protein F5878DRAFT_606294 [Lentinula raphanica]|uniref:Uncharacterized protein n=1 Tax=Lentinula raphanica TaxID=153919 RepID=A0AA38UJ95_9AGAR|nr:hypothetical protein F5878DRAFT_606294 [Lentinula raphanica]